MALSFTARVLQSAQQSVHLQSTCMGAYSIRWRIMHKKNKWLEEDQKDTSWMDPMLEYKQEVEKRGPVEPAMLHVVTRTGKLKGRPWWEKKIMERLGLDEKIGKIVIHKNTPKTNRLLMDVKHLIDVKPLHFPHGFPDDPSDYKHTILRKNGELIVKKAIEPLSVTTAEVNEEDPSGKWRLSLDILKRDLRRKLQTYSVHSEYHKAKQVYKRNQDGREYRYNVNKPGMYERPPE